MDRKILHCDLNNFYASVECLDNVQLQGKAIAVCGSEEDRHGIVLAKSEQAKLYKVETAEPIWKAKQKCPHLIIVPPRHERYLEISRKVCGIYEEYTELVENFGLDECWLDVTGSVRLFGDENKIAQIIRQRIKDEIGITVSIGVSFNKVFAKLGSDYKKPDAVTVISKENFKEKIWSLPGNELLGVGKIAYEKLKKIGVTSIGDIANLDLTYLIKNFGKSGAAMWNNANGLEDSPVKSIFEYQLAKSIGNSFTCSEDLKNDDEVRALFISLAENVSYRMRKNNIIANKLQITIKNNKFQVYERQIMLEYPSRLVLDMVDIAFELFKKHYNWKHPVRMLGIRVLDFQSADKAIQQSFTYDYSHNQKVDTLEENVDKIKEKYGRSMIQRASLMNKNPIPSDNEKGVNNLD